MYRKLSLLILSTSSKIKKKKYYDARSKIILISYENVTDECVRFKIIWWSFDDNLFMIHYICIRN